MNPLKVGTKVIIRKDLKAEKHYNKIKVVFPMLHYKGRKAKIISSSIYEGVFVYKIKFNENQPWNWSKEMFVIGDSINSKIIFKRK